MQATSDAIINASIWRKVLGGHHHLHVHHQGTASEFVYSCTCGFPPRIDESSLESIARKWSASAADRIRNLLDTGRQVAA